MGKQLATRYAFSRLMVLQRYENVPLRKTDIEEPNS